MCTTYTIVYTTGICARYCFSAVSKRINIPRQPQRASQPTRAVERADKMSNVMPYNRIKLCKLATPARAHFEYSRTIRRSNDDLWLHLPCARVRVAIFAFCAFLMLMRALVHIHHACLNIRLHKLKFTEWRFFSVTKKRHDNSGGYRNMKYGFVHRVRFIAHNRYYITSLCARHYRL